MQPSTRPAPGAGVAASPPWSPALKAIWLLWIAYGAVSAAQIYVTWYLEGLALEHWYGPAVLSLGRSVLWALATPLIIRVARSHPIRRDSALRAVAVHVGCALLLSVLDTAGNTGFLMWLRGGAMPAVLVNYVARLDLVFLYYGGIVLGTRLWDAQTAVQEREVTSARLETELAESRIELLNRQIAPHFLFNALNVVSSFVHRDAERADDVLVRLSEMLRRSLSRADVPVVTLREELEALLPYLDIQRARHEWLRVEYDITPAAEAALVPSMLLQPLVENAIVHGIEPAERAGTLTLRASDSAGTLEILVEDDGLGVERAAPSGFGLGLDNVRARLRHLYGEQATLSLEHRPGTGTRARVALPLSYATGSPGVA